MEIFAHAGKLYKIVKYQAIEGSGRGRGSGPTWWHWPARLGAARHPLASCHITDSPQVQETHSQASSTVDSKSVHNQGQKRGITRIADSPSSMSGAQMDKTHSYTHSTTPLGAPHLNSALPTDALPPPPGTPLSLHRLPFGHMQGNTLGSNPMHQFKAVKDLFNPRARRRCHLNR
jgi:hypothetical protein